MIRSVVFDVDDTLYLERDYVRSGFEAVSRWLQQEAGIKGFGALAWQQFESGARGDIFNRTLALVACPVSDELIARLVTVYRTHNPTIAISSDALATLDALARQFACAVVTDGPAESQRRKINALGLEKWMSPLVATAELGPGKSKPASDAFVLIEAAHRHHGAECVYVGDNVAKDFAGPKSLGWHTIRVRRPGGLHAAADSTGDVDAEIVTFDELPGVLTQW